MPTKRIVALIFFFWFLTNAYIAYRDVWPRLFVDSQPKIAIDLADEAAHNVEVRWGIFRGDKEIGRLTTYLKYVEADDSFEFTCEYKRLELEVQAIRCEIPELVTKDTVTRGGDLKKQSLKGTVKGYLFGAKLIEGEANIQGNVINGQLTTQCSITSTLGKFNETLDPIFVPKGQPINPLQPINRLTNLKPGHSWYVQMSSPLEDAIAAVIQKQMLEHAIKLPERKNGQLLAQVKSDQQDFDWYGLIVPCWVIEYRRDEPVARTWVRASDGRVLKQEAFRNGEQLAVVRDR